jgi:hypothetical protein
MEINETDQNFIYEASDFFLNPGPIAKSLNFIGKPVEALAERLPDKIKKMISAATQKAIEKALITAAHSFPEPKKTNLNQETASQFSSWLHKVSTTFTGGVSGFFGLSALPIELPITTVLILRAILDQARLYGHEINDLEIRIECLMVFAMGTKGHQDDSIESAYFTARAAHAQAIRQAAQFLAKLSSKELVESLEKGSAPAILRLVAQIAQAFEIRVTQKMVAEIVPIIGAVSGGALNFAFTDFYCTAARYHFGVRALEKKYGTEPVQELMKERMKNS